MSQRLSFSECTSPLQEYSQCEDTVCTKLWKGSLSSQEMIYCPLHYCRRIPPNEKLYILRLQWGRSQSLPALCSAQNEAFSDWLEEESWLFNERASWDSRTCRRTNITAKVVPFSWYLAASWAACLHPSAIEGSSERKIEVSRMLKSHITKKGNICQETFCLGFSLPLPIQAHVLIWHVLSRAHWPVSEMITNKEN